MRKSKAGASARRARFVWAVVPAAAAGMIWAACGGGDDPPELACDIMCPAGYIVTENCACVDTTPPTDPCQGKDCPAGHACLSGACVDTTTPTDPCQGKVCPAGQACLSGACVDTPPPPPANNFTETVNGAGIDMVFVRGGEFGLGCNDGASPKYPEKFKDDCNLPSDMPIHPVSLSNFFIGKYEVTRRQWAAVMGSGNSPPDSLPIGGVSWDDAQGFVARLNELTGKKYRLPTNAEWEFAARGGTKTQDYKFSGSHDIGSVAWYLGNSNGSPQPVGLKQANELGIHDMSGNVYEWVNDRYHNRYYSDASPKDGLPLVNPQGPASGDTRTLRGGSWHDVDWSVCRSTDRRGNDAPEERKPHYGFRVALSE